MLATLLWWHKRLFANDAGSGSRGLKGEFVVALHPGASHCRLPDLKPASLVVGRQLGQCGLLHGLWKHHKGAPAATGPGQLCMSPVLCCHSAHFVESLVADPDGLEQVLVEVNQRLNGEGEGGSVNGPIAQQTAPPTLTSS